MYTLKYNQELEKFTMHFQLRSDDFLVFTSKDYFKFPLKKFFSYHLPYIVAKTEKNYSLKIDLKLNWKKEAQEVIFKVELT